MNMPQPAAVKKVINPVVARLMVARAKAEVLREEMDAVDAQLLAEGDYQNEYSGERILKPGDAWTMNDEQATGYYALRDDIIAERYDVPERGYCPACMAENEVTNLNKELIDAANPFFPELTYDRVSRKLETYHKTVELLVGLAFAA